MPTRKQSFRTTNRKRTIKGKRRAKLQKINNDSKSKEMNQRKLYHQYHSTKKPKTKNINNTSNIRIQVSEPMSSNYQCNKDGKIINLKYNESDTDSSTSTSSSYFYSSSYYNSSNVISKVNNASIKWCITVKIPYSCAHTYGELNEIELKYLCINDNIIDYYCTNDLSETIIIRNHLHIYDICNKMMVFGVIAKLINVYDLGYHRNVSASQIWKYNPKRDMFSLKNILMNGSNNLLSNHCCSIIIGYLINDKQNRNFSDLLYINVYGKVITGLKKERFYYFPSWNWMYGSTYGYIWKNNSTEIQFRERNLNCSKERYQPFCVPKNYVKQRFAKQWKPMRLVTLNDTCAYIKAIINHNTFLKDLNESYKQRSIKKHKKLNHVIKAINTRIKRHNLGKEERSAEYAYFDVSQITEQLSGEFNEISDTYEIWIAKRVSKKPFHGMLNKINNDRYTFDYSYNENDNKQKWYKNKQRRAVKLHI